MIAVEGFEASRFAKRIAAQRGFHPPILGEIYAILHGGKNINIPDFMEKSLDCSQQKRGFSNERQCQDTGHAALNSPTENN